MKIKLLNDLLIDGNRVHKGDIIDIDDSKKDVWIAKGWAEPVNKEIKVKKETKELKVKKDTKNEADKD